MIYLVLPILLQIYLEIILTICLVLAIPPKLRFLNKTKLSQMTKNHVRNRFQQISAHISRLTNWSHYTHHLTASPEVESPKCIAFLSCDRGTLGGPLNFQKIIPNKCHRLFCWKFAYRGNFIRHCKRQKLLIRTCKGKIYSKNNILEWSQRVIILLISEKTLINHW